MLRRSDDDDDRSEDDSEHRAASAPPLTFKHKTCLNHSLYIKDGGGTLPSPDGSALTRRRLCGRCCTEALCWTLIASPSAEKRLVPLRWRLRVGQEAELQMMLRTSSMTLCLYLLLQVWLSADWTLTVKPAAADRRRLLEMTGSDVSSSIRGMFSSRPAGAPRCLQCFSLCGVQV